MLFNLNKNMNVSWNAKKASIWIFYRLGILNALVAITIQQWVICSADEHNKMALFLEIPWFTLLKKMHKSSSSCKPDRWQHNDLNCFPIAVVKFRFDFEPKNVDIANKK